MSELMRLDEEYRNWIQDLGNRYKTSQIKASIRVNNEMLMYYWSVGKDITERHADSKWGNKFFQNMSMDMTDVIPNAKGFSPTNLRYMMRFYALFKDDRKIMEAKLFPNLRNNSEWYQIKFS